MIAHSQPIALPTTPMTNDYPMGSGSYTGTDAGSSFNPASYTRHFVGSPISWRASSWGMSMDSARYPTGSPSAHMLNSVECVSLVFFGGAMLMDERSFNEYRAGRSAANESYANSLGLFQREMELVCILPCIQFCPD